MLCDRSPKSILPFLITISNIAGTKSNSPSVILYYLPNTFEQVDRPLKTTTSSTGTFNPPLPTSITFAFHTPATRRSTSPTMHPPCNSKYPSSILPSIIPIRLSKNPNPARQANCASASRRYPGKDVLGAKLKSLAFAIYEVSRRAIERQDA